MIGRTNAAVGTVKNPYTAKSEAEMAKYCDAKYAGAFVKFLDPAYYFSVPKTFECGIFGLSNGQFDSRIDFIFDNRREIKEVEEVLDKIIVESDELILLTTLTYVNGKNETSTCKIYGCKSSTTNSKGIYAEYPRDTSFDRYLMWQKGLTTNINDSMLTFFINQGMNYTDFNDAEKQELLKLIAPNEGWLYPLTDGYINNDDNVDYMGISMFALTILAYNENKNITITQMLPGAEKLYVMPGLSPKYLDGHIYQIIKSDEIVSKYIAASPLTIGDSFAGATIKFNTEMNYDQVMNLMYQIPWNEGYIYDGDGTAYYYCIFNNAPDMGYSTYTGEKFDESKEFWKAISGIIFVKFATDEYTDYGIILGGENWIWVSNHQNLGGNTDGWQVTQVTIPAATGDSSFTQDPTITRINAQDIVNQLFSKTTFTTLSSDFKYEAILYNEDGKASPLGVPVGAIHKSSNREIDNVLSQRENLGKIYKYCGYSQGKYITNNYYIVEEVTE